MFRYTRFTDLVCGVLAEVGFKEGLLLLNQINKRLLKSVIFLQLNCDTKVKTTVLLCNRTEYAQ